MADWDTKYKNEEVPSPMHSREGSESSELSSLGNKENHVLNRLDSETSTADSQKNLILQDGKWLKGESATDAKQNDLYDDIQEINQTESPSRSTKPQTFTNGNRGTAKARAAKSPFAPSTMDAIKEEEITIPKDGNLSSFTTDQMANFFRCINIDDRIISHLHRKNVDGRRFSKLKDSEMEAVGMKSNPVILFFKERSITKSKKGNGWLL